MREIDEAIRGKRSYFTDDTLRTIGAVEPGLKRMKKPTSKATLK
jgi:hypothetical protein